jgi:hypothetical protein
MIGLRYPQSSRCFMRGVVVGILIVFLSLPRPTPLMPLPCAFLGLPFVFPPRIFLDICANDCDGSAY